MTFIQCVTQSTSSRNMCSTLYAENTCHDKTTVGLQSLCPPNLGLLAGATRAGKEIFKAPMSVHLCVLCISNRVRSIGEERICMKTKFTFYLYFLHIYFILHISTIRLDIEKKMCILTSKLNILMLKCYKCLKLTVQK